MLYIHWWWCCNWSFCSLCCNIFSCWCHWWYTRYCCNRCCCGSSYEAISAVFTGVDVVTGDIGTAGCNWVIPAAGGIGDIPDTVAPGGVPAAVVVVIGAGVNFHFLWNK